MAFATKPELGREVVSSFEKFQTEPPAKLRNDGMSDAPKKQSRAWIGWALIAVVVVYPLSIGPAFLICRKTNTSLVWMESAYQPLFWAVNASQLVQRAFNWYMALFG
jgi:hypothetical protein